MTLHCVREFVYSRRGDPNASLTAVGWSQLAGCMPVDLSTASVAAITEWKFFNDAWDPANRSSYLLGLADVVADSAEDLLDPSKQPGADYVDVSSESDGGGNAKGSLFYWSVKNPAVTARHYCDLNIMYVVAHYVHQLL